MFEGVPGSTCAFSSRTTADEGKIREQARCRSVHPERKEGALLVQIFLIGCLRASRQPGPGTACLPKPAYPFGLVLEPCTTPLQAVVLSHTACSLSLVRLDNQLPDACCICVQNGTRGSATRRNGRDGRAGAGRSQTA
ncbi:hypothetical protein FKP32DRAFT_1358054 [Trametes sanguinea]|nr:hypothetical protein FKP32DRAFT_1358054 [Trametes sanguinea]